MPGKIYRPHFSTATDARVQRTRDALRNALLELLQSRPFEQITIREIAATAGIGYTTFFRHYPSTETLLEEIAAAEMRQLLEHVLCTFGTEDTAGSSRAIFQYVHDHRALWSTLLTGGAAGTLRDEFIRVADEVTASSGLSTPWLPSDIGIRLVASGTMELLAWWLSQRLPLGVESVATIYDRAVLGPIFSDLAT